MKKIRFLISLLLMFTVTVTATAQVLTAVPTETQRDGQPVTVGMVFSPFSEKVVTGVRFYRHSTWSGPTRVGVWDAVTGTLLTEGQVAAGGTGWVIVPVQPEITLQPGNYIAAYSNRDGWYSTQTNYFPRQFAEYNAPNSRYIYSAFSFPTETYQNSNYFVEPILADVPTVTPPVECSDTVIIVYRDTMRIILRDTIYVPTIDTIWNVVYLEGRDTLVVDRSPNYTDSALQTWPLQGIWNYEFTIGNKKHRFMRTFVWRREEFIDGKWVPED